MLRILVIDDVENIRAGFAANLCEHFIVNTWYDIGGVNSSLISLVSLSDIILLDNDMVTFEGIDILLQVRHLTDAVIYGITSNPVARMRMLSSGAIDAFIVKDPKKISRWLIERHG